MSAALCYRDLNCVVTVTAKIEGFVCDLRKLVKGHRNEINLDIKCLNVLPWCVTCGAVNAVILQG